VFDLGVTITAFNDKFHTCLKAALNLKESVEYECLLRKDFRRFGVKVFPLKTGGEF
jgi:hypothetical protein